MGLGLSASGATIEPVPLGTVPPNTVMASPPSTAAAAPSTVGLVAARFLVRLLRAAALPRPPASHMDVPPRLATAVRPVATVF